MIVCTFRFKKMFDIIVHVSGLEMFLRPAAVKLSGQTYFCSDTTRFLARQLQIFITTYLYKTKFSVHYKRKGPDKTNFWPDIVRWPAVTSIPDMLLWAQSSSILDQKHWHLIYYLTKTSHNTRLKCLFHFTLIFIQVNCYLCKYLK